MSLERIVEEAAELADDVGLAQLSLSDLAARLGVKSPSLYNHVNGLDDVKRLLAIHASKVLGSEIGRATVGKSRDDAVLAMAQAHRRFVKTRPGLAESSIRAPDKGDAEANAAASAVVETLLNVLQGYGLKKKRALHVIRALRSSVHGFATLEAGGGFGIPLDVDESFDWMVDALLKSLKREV